VPNTNVGLKWGFSATIRNFRQGCRRENGDFGNNFLEKGAELGFAGTMDNIHDGEFPPSTHEGEGQAAVRWGRKRGRKKTKKTTNSGSPG
jgi:hypothetical protein